jgi:hypothetical protein
MAVLALHGVIHVLGFASVTGPGDVPGLDMRIGTGEGLLWLAAGVLLGVAAVAIRVTPRFWWIPALLGVILSQVLVIESWSDARFGTLVNLALLAPIAVSAADVRPSSLRSIYRNRVRWALASAPRDPAPVTVEDLQGLPAPVRTYLERAGVVGRPRIASFGAGFRARIRGGPDEAWMEGTAEQHGLFDPPVRLFFMTARRAGLPVHVLHRYEDGAATMEGRLLGLFTVFELSGPKLTRSETVTLLNDIFFMAPAALVDLPADWELLDDGRVRCAFTHAGYAVSAIVHFDAEGDLADFESEDRYQMERDPPVLARWSTPFYEYRDYRGFRLPSGGEARWGDPGEEWAYGDFELRWIAYNLGSRS